MDRGSPFGRRAWPYSPRPGVPPDGRRARPARPTDGAVTGTRPGRPEQLVGRPLVLGGDARPRRSAVITGVNLVS